MFQNRVPNLPNCTNVREQNLAGFVMAFLHLVGELLAKVPALLILLSPL
jgi:hypothetical protein